MNDRYWKKKYADYHSRSESRIAELEKENAELKKAVETLLKRRNGLLNNCVHISTMSGKT